MKTPPQRCASIALTVIAGRHHRPGERSFAITRSNYVYELQDWVIVGELCTSANPMKVDSPAYVLGAADVKRLVRIA